MQSTLIELLLHFAFYVAIFLASAFYAAKSYRSQEDPEQQPFADAAGKSAPVQAAGDDELRGAKSKRERSTLSDVWDEILVFVRDPVPFLADTANVDDDTVHHRAGLEARLYLHFLRTLLTLFTIIAFVVCALIIPANIMTARASWMPLGYYSSTTANGFAHPSASLLLHTLVSVFISVVVVVVVYFTREHLVSNVRGDLQNKAATPPVQAYTVEIQGMRLNPPVRPEEVMTMLDASPNLKGQHSDVVTADDVTEIVDHLDEQLDCIKKLARFRQQHENEGIRPTCIVGPLSWMYLGEKVDAIEKLEEEIRELDKLIDAAQRCPLTGTGTAFVSFKHRAGALEFIKAFSDARKAKKATGLPSIGPKPTDMCMNPTLWSVSMATRPEDVSWRNLRYTRLQNAVLTFVGVCLLLVALSFVVTPLFFIQVFLSLEQMTVEGAEEAKDAVTASPYQRHFTHYNRASGWNMVVLSLLTPLLIVVINYFVMPAMVKWAVRHFGNRTISGKNSTTFALTFSFMIVNLLFIPALSLGSLEAFVEVTQYIPIDQVLAQVVLYGSAGVFFIDYAAQAALLATAFYFVFHTTSPKIHNWAHGGRAAVPLTWEFDFAYFYSSLLSIVAIALMFSVTVPVLLIMVAVFLYVRYYLDKWQLVTAHSNANPAPSPENTASAVLVGLILVAALSQAAFGAWLNLQGAAALALLAWLASAALVLCIAVPSVRRNLITVSSTWNGDAAEHPETWHVPAPASYKGAYANPYVSKASGARDSLKDFYHRDQGRTYEGGVSGVV